MLQTSFYMLVECIALGWPECEAYLERIAVAHGKHGRDIAPHLYDLWLRPRTARGGAGKPAPPPGAAAARAGILPACWKPKYNQRPRRTSCDPNPQASWRRAVW